MSVINKKYSSAVRYSLQLWIDKVKKLDILIGIPCYNNEDTIKHVVKTAGEGLKKYYPDLRTGILISDGGSLDDTREQAYDAPLPEGVERRVTIYRGIPGKGTSFRAIFETAEALGVKVCCVLDSDLRSVTPEWIPRIITPILEDKAQFITPYYKRHKYDGTITNHIIYPTTSALYGLKIRQPIGGDFGFAGEIASWYVRQDIWHTDVARFGIDIWMTTSAINEGFKVGQTYLGAKIHDTKDPAADLAPMFRQVVSTLFYLIGRYASNWKKIKGLKDVEIFNFEKNGVEVPPVKVSMDNLKAEFLEGFEHFEAFYKQVINPDAFAQLTEHVQQLKKKDLFQLPFELWAQILYDFAYTYQTWHRNRRRLVDIMTPLYFGRVAAFCKQTEKLSNEEAEEIIEKQVQVFSQMKDYLINRFTPWEELQYNTENIPESS